MRYDKRYGRTRVMLSHPEIPAHAGGGICLCHQCQRSAWLAGGFLEMLIWHVEATARFRGAHNGARRNASTGT